MHSRSLGPDPTAHDDADRADESRERLLARDPRELARDVAGAVEILAEELEDERACTRMLRAELGKANARIAELERELAAERLAVAIRDGRPVRTGVA